MDIVIRSIATANPPRYARQREVYEFLTSHYQLDADEHALYRRLLLDGPIRGRYLGLEYDEQACQTNADILVDRFRKFGTSLASEAARQALQQAGLAPADVGGLVVNTCTGYLCPGLSSYVAEELSLSPSVRVFDLMGMGCGGAIPNLQCAAGSLAGGQCRSVLCISAEVCSTTMVMGPARELVVSNSIFGDGASAAVLSVADNGGPKLPRLVDFESLLLPRYRRDLHYRTEQGRLRNVLSLRVPVIGAAACKQVTERLLERRGLNREQIRWWAVHPGGSSVLEQVAEKLQLPTEALRFSRDIFRDYGNMSSPSVMFVLKRIIEQGRPDKGDLGVAVAFGAGFTAFAALLEF